MGEAIVITSGKGGSGKSTLTCALGKAMARSGKSVALVDMDMGMRSLDILMGVQDRVVYDILDVAEGVSKIKPALIQAEGAGELYVLNAAATRDSCALTAQQAERIIGKLKQKFDYVLIDCPAGVGRGFRSACGGADRAVLVALPDAVSVRDAERVIGLLERCDIRGPMLVVNRTPMDGMMADGLSVEGIRERLRLELIGWVAEDPGVRLGRENRQMADIARRLMGEEVKLEPHRRTGYWKRLGRAIRGR